MVMPSLVKVVLSPVIHEHLQLVHYTHGLYEFTQLKFVQNL